MVEQTDKEILVMEDLDGLQIYSNTDHIVHLDGNLSRAGIHTQH
jgi:hypothetical protein